MLLKNSSLAERAKHFGVSLDWAKDLEKRASQIQDKPFVPTPDPNENRPPDLGTADEVCLV